MDGGGDAVCGYWDVTGGFQNVKKNKVPERMGMTDRGKRWRKWMSSLMCERSSALSWHCKDRGVGKTNVGVHKGLLLLPLVFLIWMVPILEEMQ